MPKCAPCSREKMSGSILRIAAAAPSIWNLWHVTSSPIASCSGSSGCYVRGPMSERNSVQLSMKDIDWRFRHHIC